MNVTPEAPADSGILKRALRAPMVRRRAWASLEPTSALPSAACCGAARRSYKRDWAAAELRGGCSVHVKPQHCANGEEYNVRYPTLCQGFSFVSPVQYIHAIRLDRCGGIVDKPMNGVWITCW